MPLVQGPQILGDQNFDRLTDDLILCIAKDLLRAVIEGDDLRVLIRDNNRIQGAVQNGSQKFAIPILRLRAPQIACAGAGSERGSIGLRLRGHDLAGSIINGLQSRRIADCWRQAAPADFGTTWLAPAKLEHALVETG